MWHRFNLNRFFLAVALTVISFGGGLLGFVWIENYTLAEAFYMTMITVSTVGFGELHPLSPAGRLFVSCYIFFNLLVVAYLVSVLTAYIFGGELRNLFHMLRTDQEIRNVSNHVIVCGFGRNGSKAYHELRQSGAPVVIVEQNEALLNETVEKLGGGVLAVFGDATTDETLLAAGIGRARAIIAALPKDADNMFVTLTARELNPGITIIARASLKTSEAKLLRAGADSVVMPDEIGGAHMANLVIRPEVVRFLDMLLGLEPNKLRLQELCTDELRPAWRGRTLRELDIAHHTGATVIGLKSRGREMQISPAADTVPQPGDMLLCLGTDEQITAVLRQFQV